MLAFRSKQFTAAAVLYLEQRGWLAVEDTIAQYLRVLPEVPEDKADTTLHQLLTHTAGFEEDHFEGELTPMTAEEAMTAIYALPLA